MSQKANDGTRTARDKLHAQRERDKRAGKRIRVLKVSGAVIAVLGVAAGVGTLVSQQGGADGNADAADAKPISVGERRAPAKLTVFEDFRCPACAQFEKQYGDTVRELERAGKLRTEYHLVPIIDDTMGGNGSQRAANAAWCAEDQGKFTAYHDVLFQHQPSEQDDAFASADKLLQLAGKVPGLRGADFEKCVTSGAHDQRVTNAKAGFDKSGHDGTPTVLLNGKNIFANPNDPVTPRQLKQKVAAGA